MKIGYIPYVKSAPEFQMVINMMNQFGVECHHIIINQSFAEFTATLNDGDLVVVYDLDYFNNLTEIIDVGNELAVRGIRLLSITDPWYNNTSERHTMLKGVTDLLNRIRTTRTQAGLIKAKKQGKKLGRPVGTIKLKDKIAEVTRLREKSNLSVLKACALAKCNPRSYYRHVKIKSELKSNV